MRPIFKVHPDHDLYMAWVMAADGPADIGTREEFLNAIRELQEREHYGFVPLPHNTPEAIMDRIDETGTNCRPSPYGHTGAWSDSGLIFDQFWFPRGNWYAFAKACFDTGKNLGVDDFPLIIQPIEDDVP